MHKDSSVQRCVWLLARLLSVIVDGGDWVEYEDAEHTRAVYLLLVEGHGWV